MNRKQIFIFGILTYTALLFLALFFYKERTIFTDIAFHLFYYSKDGNIFIQNNRFGAALTQWVPVLAMDMELPLTTVLKLYSGWFILYYLIIFLIVLLKFKNKELALTLLGFSFLMTTDTFYWIQSELPQGIGFCILCFAWLEYQDFKTKNILYFIIQLIFLGTILFFHPLLIFVYGFLQLFFLMRYRLLFPEESKFKKHIYSLLLYIGLFIIKSFLIPETEYDSRAMGQLSSFISLFPNYFDLRSNRNFLFLLAKNYYLLGFLLLLIWRFYFKNKQKLNLRFFLAFFFGYLLLINVTHSYLEPNFYAENLYLPLSIFVLVPFAYDFLPQWNYKNKFLLLGILISFRLLHLCANSTKFTDRLNWQREFLTETYPNKVLMNSEDAPMDLLWMEWSSPYEFWLLSTIETGKTRCIFITNEWEKFKPQAKMQQYFITKFGASSYEKLKPPYFILEDNNSYILYDKNK